MFPTKWTKLIIPTTMKQSKKNTIVYTGKTLFTGHYSSSSGGGSVSGSSSSCKFNLRYLKDYSAY